MQAKHHPDCFWYVVSAPRSQVKQEDPLNLSILLGGGKETN